MKKLIYFISLMIFSATANSQTPQIPSGKPGKVPLPNPALQALKPDLIITGINNVVITEQPSSHNFLITMRVTVKNQGPVTANGSYLDLRSRFGTTSGGTDYSVIGDKVWYGTLYRGESRGVKISFTKDVTELGRARLECVLRIDCENHIAESNEDNNQSTFFYITPPGR